MRFLEDEDGDLPLLGGDDYGFMGPGISSDMPEAMLIEPVSRVQEALTAESGNFLMFVADAIREKHHRVDEDVAPVSDDGAATGAEEVSFDEVILPTTNNKMIASQAFMMTLTLGTKGLLDVRQDDHFADINLSLTEKGKAAQVEIPLQEADEAHFEEEEAVLDEAAHGSSKKEEAEAEADEDDDEGSVYGD